MATHETVIKVLAVLGAAYPRFTVPEPKKTQQVYEELLTDIPDDMLKAAAQQCATIGTFFPSVAELRRAALELAAKARGELTAEEAWVGVQRAIARFGWYGETDPDGGWRVPRELSELQRRAIEGLGGWKLLCESENAAADRAHFLRIYESLQQVEHGEGTMLPSVREVVNRLAASMGKPQLVAPRDGPLAGRD